jgi:hypothetical protein
MILSPFTSIVLVQNWPLSSFVGQRSVLNKETGRWTMSTIVIVIHCLEMAVVCLAVLQLLISLSFRNKRTACHDISLSTLHIPRVGVVQVAEDIALNFSDEAICRKIMILSPSGIDAIYVSFCNVSFPMRQALRARLLENIRFPFRIKGNDPVGTSKQTTWTSRRVVNNVE